MNIRRHRLDLNTPAELAIYNAIQEVEKVGADVTLTEAVTLLSKARELVADFVDSHKSSEWEARDRRQVNSQEWFPVNAFEAEFAPMQIYEYRRKLD